MRAIGEMLRDGANFWNGETWTMSIRDETGTIVATLTFTAT